MNHSAHIPTQRAADRAILTNRLGRSSDLRSGVLTLGAGGGAGDPIATLMAAGGRPC